MKSRVASCAICGKSFTEIKGLFLAINTETDCRDALSPSTEYVEITKI
ncbi:hypothetical protein [Paenilisteria weihenstephanensis]|nr:hypothetical protein [Listeria weihenstephanensis]